MLAFTLRRAIQAIGVMIAVGVIAFSMFRFAGDPVNQIVSLDTPAAEREAVRKSLGLDDPVPVQFARYFANAAQFKKPSASMSKLRAMSAITRLSSCKSDRRNTLCRPFRRGV
jgi:ABC-type dipeptide/oligopeptide/nickel transport system permease component